MTRILYIEDDAFSIEELRKHFEKEAPDISVDVDQTAAAGLQKLRENDYDALLVDYGLPDQSGVDVVRQLHAARMILPAIVITGNDQEEVLTSVLRAGASDYVVKRGNYVAKLPGILRSLILQYSFRKKVQSRIPAKQHTILFADSDDEYLKRAQEYFRQHVPRFILRTAISASEVINTLTTDRSISLVVSDLRLPNSSALEIIRTLKHQNIHTPFVILTSEGDENITVAALKLGAYDYILKNGNFLPELANSVENAIHRSEMDALSQRLYTELENMNASLEAQVQRRTAELQNEIELRRKSEAELKDALRQREVLLMEIHHRVKNNLQIVSSLINLQLRSVEDPKNRDLLRTLGARVQSMALVHQALYNSTELENLDFGGHLKSLSAALFDSYGVDRSRIQLDLDCPNLFLDMNTSIPLSLIVNEIVSNSLKHAFPDGRQGRIEIRGTRRDSQITLEIQDDGVGFEKPESEKTLGLKLIDLLTRQVDAKIHMEQMNGTRYLLELEVPSAKSVIEESVIRQAHG